MVRHRSRIFVLALVSCAICACTQQTVPSPVEPINLAPTPPATFGALDFLGGIYPHGLVIAAGDLYANGSEEPLGTKNDGYGNLVPLLTTGLENLISPPLAPREQHSGRVNRDTRVADFDNSGFPGVVANTYDCVDPLNPDDIVRLYKNNGDGTMTEVLDPFKDSKGNPITLQGRGETIVVADFNNDGFLDIFIPFYSYDSTDQDPEGPPGAICENSKQSYLLLNDGKGHFTDVADAAGVSLRNLPTSVEGAQAVDFNGDGLIDLLAGSHMFINTGITNGVPHFIDMGPALGLPSIHEEGAKFIDAYNDGFLDLVLQDPNKGPTLFKFNGSKFVEMPAAFPAESYSQAFGVNAYDINNDGLEDVVIIANLNCDPKILLNTGSGFVPVVPRRRGFTLDQTAGDPFGGICPADGAGAFADLNNDGKIDFLWPTFTHLLQFTNNTKLTNTAFSIELLGPNGEQNQQGRVVRMSPQSRPDVVFTRVVDGGSGYLSQNQYPLLIGSPYSEQHIVKVSLPQNFNSNKLAHISFTITSGQKARVFAPSIANPNGKVELSPKRPFIFDPALYPAAQGILE